MVRGITEDNSRINHSSSRVITTVIQDYYRDNNNNNLPQSTLKEAQLNPNDRQVLENMRSFNAPDSDSDKSLSFQERVVKPFLTIILLTQLVVLQQLILLYLELTLRLIILDLTIIIIYLH
jgi:hypothetical protein